MLSKHIGYAHSTLERAPTLKVIHDIGSSSGIGVLLMSFKLRLSSSNSNVKMAPGGVQVPTIKWCFILQDEVVDRPRICGFRDEGDDILDRGNGKLNALY